VIVVDASAMVAALIDSSARGELAREAMTTDVAWIAPAHMPLEVLRTIRRHIVTGSLTEDQAALVVYTLRSVEITYVGMSDDLLAAVWSMRHNISAYDAAYVALAVIHSAAILTADVRMAKAAQQTIGDVDVRTF